MIIRDGDLADDRVLALREVHLAGLHANSPPEAVFALDLSGLQRADVSFYTVWEGEALLAMGALKELAPDAGEVKSMRTAEPYLRRGAAALLLNHIISVARSRQYRRLSLETGTGDAFEPALALYRGCGFRSGEAFSDYEPSVFSQFLHLELDGRDI